MKDDVILLAHGSGGRLMHDLIRKSIAGPLTNPILDKMDDSAVLDIKGKLAFTTDSYVVKPIFFPGGDIGRLAICGTVNDLSTTGAVPRYLSLSLIIEEGLAFTDLEKIMSSIVAAATEAEVKVVTGDTKVVDKGSADKLFINTSGVGKIPDGVNISGANARPGDKIIVSGTIGDHGIAVMSQREGLKFNSPIASDCAPLNHLVAKMIKAGDIHCLRDPTRGGLASTLSEFAAQSCVGIQFTESSLPVNPAVAGACELLGLDPLYVANEGKMVAVVAAADANRVLAQMKETRYSRDATIIGEVIAEHPGRVIMETRLGSYRVVDLLAGELLPRIC